MWTCRIPIKGHQWRLHSAWKRRRRLTTLLPPAGWRWVFGSMLFSRVGKGWISSTDTLAWAILARFLVAFVTGLQNEKGLWNRNPWLKMKSLRFVTLWLHEIGISFVEKLWKVKKMNCFCLFLFFLHSAVFAVLWVKLNRSRSKWANQRASRKVRHKEFQPIRKCSLWFGC